MKKMPQPNHSIAIACATGPRGATALPTRRFANRRNENSHGSPMQAAHSAPGARGDQPRMKAYVPK